MRAPSSPVLFALTLAGAVGILHLSRVDATTSAVQATGTYVIAHRGASAYAPEHTAAAYRLAIEQGADYVEPDIALTKDGVFVSSHDGSLDRTSDVKERFPDRFAEVKMGDRVQRRWLVEDFTLAEIKSLDAGSWFDPKFKGEKMMTLQETIDLVKGKAGIFPELKVPGRLRAKGFDPEQTVADILRKNGLVGAMVKGRPAVHMQVFEEDSVRRLAKILPEVPRSFLLSASPATARWLTPEGLAEVKTFATGIAPAYQIIDRDPDVVVRAHAAGLTVVPYTFIMRPKTTPSYPDAPPALRQQLEAQLQSMPTTREALTAQMRKFVEVHKVDGMFTDYPDLFPR